jgi:hypothetical protein
MEIHMANNFLLLKSNWTDLFNYAVKAKNNISGDPSIACVHMRCFAEHLVDVLYQHLNLSTPSQTAYLHVLISMNLNNSFLKSFNQACIWSE